MINLADAAVSHARRGPEMSQFAPIHQAIADYLAKNYDVALDAIAPESTFEDIGVDSLGVLGLVTLLENKFGLKFESSMLLEVRTFASLMEVVKTRSAQLA